MSLARLTERKKAEAEGKSKKGGGGGPPASPPEFLQEAQIMVDQQGPEVTAKLAKLAVNDMGAYTNAMEALKEQIGPAAADLVHAGVQERLDRVEMAKADSPGKEMPKADMTGDEIQENLTQQMAEKVGVTPEEAKEANEAPPEEESAGPSPEEKSAEQQAAAEATAASLVQDMGSKPGVPTDKVPIKVDGEAMAKTESAGAAGMVQDGLVYLHPDEYNPSSKDGQKLVAEETIHWVQQQHALTGAGAEQSPLPAVEREAKDLADKFSRGEKVAPPKEVLGPDDVAMDTGTAGAEPPDKITLNFGGATLEVPMPGGSEKTVTLQLGSSPIPGLSLSTAAITFDDEWNIESGEVTAAISVGNFVSADNVKLTVDGSGAVQCTITGAALTVGDLINGTMDLQLSAGGITGTATVNHEQVILPLGIILLEGFLRVTLNEEGNVAAVGNVVFEMPGVGTCTLNASLDNEIIGGTVSLIVENPIPLAGGVTLKNASISGNYMRDGFRMSGQALVNVNEWAEANITGTYEFPSMSWSANGTVTQLQPMTFGELEVSGGQLNVVVENGNVTEVGGGGNFATSQFTGSLGGTYDVNAQSFSGAAQAQLIEEIPLGSVARLTAAAGSATIENNELVEITSGATAVIQFQGEDTFEAVASDCVYDVKASELSGTGTVSLLRPLEFSVGAGFMVTIDAGASASATVAANELTEVTGGLTFKVSDSAGELGTGSVELNFNGDAVSGEGSFTLGSDYGVPDREAGPAQIKAGSGVRVTIADSAPETLFFENLEVELTSLGSDQSGALLGTINGSVGLSDMAFTGSASVSVSSAWTETASWGEFTLQEGGTVTTNFDGGALGTLTVEAVSISALITAGGQSIAMTGTINGEYDAESNLASGSLEISLDDDFSVALGSDEVVIKGGSGGTAEFQANELQQISFNFELEYLRGGELFLAGSVPDGVYDASTGKVSFTGGLSLENDIEVTSGQWTLKVPSGVELTVNVQDSALTEVTSESIGFEVWDSEKLLEGNLTGVTLTLDPMKFTGELDVRVATDFSYPRTGEAPGTDPDLQLTVKTGSGVTGSMTENNLTTVTANLDFDLVFPGGAGTGHAEGTWDVENDKFTGSGNFKLTSDYLVAGAADGGQDLTQWALYIASESEVAVDFADNALQEATVDVGIKLKQGAEVAATGGISGAYKFGDEAGFTGTLNFNLEKDIELGEAGRFTAFLGQETGAEATVAGSKIVSATGDFVLLAKEGGEPAVKASVNCTYQEGTGISGSASIQVLKQILMGQGGEYSVYLETETGGNVTVTNNELGAVDGQITISIAKGGESFAKGNFTVAYDFSQADAKIDAEGSVEITSSLELGEAAGYKFTLTGGSNLNIKITQSELETIGGKLGLSVGDPEEFFTIELEGTYTHGSNPDFSGTGKATVTREKDLGAELNGYQFLLMPTEGPTVEFELAAGELVSIGGNIKVQARKDGGSIDIGLSGTYTHGSKEFTGTGTCTVNQPLEIGGAGQFSFEIQGGSGLEIDVTANEISRIKGTLLGAVKWDGDFLEINAEVTYRTANDGEVDVDGSAKITGEKKIFGLGDYEFWLIPSDGFVAMVKVEKNELKEVSSEVSFKIMDGESEPLITGSANGAWTAATNNFTGGGDLRLGRDVTLGSDSFKVHFLAGSGGNAQVNESKLESLGGTLKAEVESDGKRLVRVEAEGEYNAVEKKLVRLEGSATLLQPLELFGGKVKLLGASGHAKIINNELVAAGGQADVEVEGFKKINGKIEFEWSKESGEDEYTGSAELEVEVNDKIKGSCKVELLPGNDFKISGEVEYKLNEMIKGTVGIEVGSDLNPILSGKIELTDVELIPGRDLFGMEFDVLPPTAIGSFYGLNLVLGCAAGMKASMQPVTFSAGVEVSNFKPLEMNMPDFEVEMGLSGGLDFMAAIKPYIGISGGVSGAQAGIAVEGALQLNVPITLSPKLTLRGGPDGFSGEFAFGLTIAPTLSLIVTPFVFAELGGSMARHDLTNWTIPLGELFRYEWNKTYKFGDAGPGADDGGAEVSEEAPSEGNQTQEKNESGELESMTAAAGGKSADGPDLDAGGDMAMGGPDGGGDSEIGQKMAEMEEMAEKVANVAYLFGLIMDIVAIGMLPPFGWTLVPAYLCYRIFIVGDLTVDKISQSVNDLFDLLNDAFAWLLENLPQWVKDIYEWITSGAGNVLGDMAEWLGENLQALGEAAVDFLKDAGEWGAEIISGAGEWAMEAAGWAMDAISDVGSAIGDAASDAWDYFF